MHSAVVITQQVDITDICRDGDEMWNQFESIPDDDGDERSGEYCFEVLTKVLKIFMYFVFFIIILGGILVCKACIIIMTHQYKSAAVSTTVSTSFYSN